MKLKNFFNQNQRGIYNRDLFEEESNKERKRKGSYKLSNG